MSRAQPNAVYDYTPSALSQTYTSNGLNQYPTVGGTNFTYDNRGNLIDDGPRDFVFDVQNRLTQVGGTGVLGLAYDPLGRLYSTDPGGTPTRYLYDGADMIGEYNAGGTLLKRYVHGPSDDEPLVVYTGTGTGDSAKSWLLANAQGSIIAGTSSTGAASYINTYDAYGRPGATNTGRFQYTGQTWLPEAALDNYKARVYDPKIGRFLQTDPIGYAGGLNLYAYVGNDPVNATDPSGLFCWGGFAREDGDGVTGGFSHCFDWDLLFPPGSAAELPEGAGRGGGIVEAIANFIIPNAAAQPNRSTPQRNSFACRSPGMATFRDAAANAYAANPYGELDWLFPFSVLRGIRVHNTFAASIRAQGYPFGAEVSYLGGVRTNWGMLGSVRADGIYGPEAAPLYVVELKSGFADMSNSEIESYRANLPPGTAICQIREDLSR